MSPVGLQMALGVRLMKVWIEKMRPGIGLMLLGVVFKRIDALEMESDVSEMKIDILTMDLDISEIKIDALKWKLMFWKWGLVG